ncbi:hypothetical protein SAMN04487965_2955 [Microbulbifer donghaiensis]|uniref:Uncharacterized protein n=1 Tax=Microbulbifer donghaiensis TaxID=494016 RepID=A0A1M5FK99_9GAMM|nr:hypothetical protein [Microbulbifer donghaiensis]SHF92037.1 hypothetical protein SAMN04487965_2955 [Microbulbifer donghaiensis]
MKSTIISVAAVASLLLSGCVSQHPQTVEEFRQAVPGAFMAKVETYEVDRPFSEVSGSFEKYAPKCLDVTIETESRTNMSYQYIVTDYNPTVVAGRDITELHLQRHHAQGVMNVTKEPEGGYYLLVADATPVGKNNTRIDIYGPSRGFDVITRAIKGWASGKNMGCPDLTKI